MTDHVDIVLRAWRQSSFIWGESDCMISIGEYVQSRGASNLIDDYRCRYPTEHEALSHLDVIGGPASIIDRSGLQRIEKAGRGDVVLVDVHGALIAGIHTGDGVALRLPRGVAEIGLRFVKIVQAWKVP